MATRLDYSLQVILSKIRRNVSADLVTKKNITKVHKDTSFI